MAVFVFWTIQEHSIPFIVLPAILCELSQSFATLCFIEVTIREHIAYIVYSLAYSVHLDCFYFPSNMLACCLYSCRSCWVFVDVSIMWEVMYVVVLIARIDDCVGYLNHWVTCSFPIVYDTKLLSVNLPEPYGCVISSSRSSQVPRGIDRKTFIVIYVCDTFLFTSYS